MSDSIKKEIQYEIKELARSINIDGNNLDEEIEQCPGKCDFIAEQLCNAIDDYANAKIDQEVLEARTEESIIKDSVDKTKKNPTVKALEVALNTNKDVIKGRKGLVKVKGDLNRVKYLYDNYVNRYKMLQSKVSLFKKRMNTIESNM